MAELMTAAEEGRPEATKQLFSALYAELKNIAHREVARAGGVKAPLGASSLLHLAYEAMVGVDLTFPARARFMGYASRVMRGLIIDHVRSRKARKRGGSFELTLLDEDVLADASGTDVRELEQLSAALDELSAVDSELTRVVDLKFFSGFSFQEIAAMDGVSERTVLRRWNRARVFLHHVLRTPIE